MTKQAEATDIASTIRAERARKDWSQEELAAKSGVSRVHIGRIERGETTNPTHSTLRSLADALGVSVSALVDGEE